MDRRTLLAATVVGALAFAGGCGGDDDEPAPNAATSTTVTGSAGGAPAVQAVTGGETRLEIDDAALRLLEVAGIAVEPQGEARRRGVGIVFPVTGGRAADDGRSGRIEHAGGLRFSAGGQSVIVDGLVLDLSDGRVSAEVGGRRLPVLDLALEPADLDVGDQRITAGGLRTTTASGVTDLLAERLSVSGLPDGLPLGRTRFAFERR